MVQGRTDPSRQDSFGTGNAGGDSLSNCDLLQKIRGYNEED